MKTTELDFLLDMLLELANDATHYILLPIYFAIMTYLIAAAFAANTSTITGLVLLVLMVAPNVIHMIVKEELERK